MATFKERLKLMMEEKDIKAADISKATKISTSAISKYLSDEKKEPLAAYVIEIAKFVNVSPEWLYGSTDIRKPFYEPSILDTYEQLSEIGKQELHNYALFILQRESANK